MDHSYTNLQDVFVVEGDDQQIADSIMECLESESLQGDSLLIDLVRARPHLYDKESKDFKDANMKRNSWEEIGVILNVPSDICSKRWTSLRDRWSKERREIAGAPSGSGASTKKIWCHYEQLSFLQCHVKRRNQFSNLGAKKQMKIDLKEPVLDGHFQMNGTQETSSLGSGVNHLKVGALGGNFQKNGIQEPRGLELGGNNFSSKLHAEPLEFTNGELNKTAPTANSSEQKPIKIIPFPQRSPRTSKPKSTATTSKAEENLIEMTKDFKQKIGVLVTQNQVDKPKPDSIEYILGYIGTQLRAIEEKEEQKAMIKKIMDIFL